MTTQCRALIVVVDYARPEKSGKGWSKGRHVTRRCRNKADEGQEFCWRHAKQRVGEVDAE